MRRNSELLVVDDNEQIRLVVRQQLAEAGYTVTACADGQKAVDALEDGCEPQLAVLDVMMPRLDGKRLLRMIRNGELPVDDQLPVVMLTSRGREEDILDGFDSGANDYMTKPFQTPELLARIQRCLDETPPSLGQAR